MANVNLLSQLAGSVAPRGEPFNATKAIAAGQQLQAGDIKLQQLRQQLDLDAQEAVSRQRAQEILQRVAMGGAGYEEAGRELLAVDPRTGMRFIEFARDDEAQQTELAQQQAQAERFQNLLASSPLPDEQKALAAQMFPHDPKAALNMLAPEAAAGGPEYGLSPVYVQDADGNVRIAQLSKSGDVLMPDLPGTVLPGIQFLDVGTGYQPLDRRSGAPAGQYVPKDIRGQATEEAYGELTAEHIKTKPKQVQQFLELSREWDIAKEDIAKAIDRSGFWTSGWAGRVTDAVPGTPAYELKALLESIKARIGFQKLQQMRESSPTGGALGQVSNFENQLLQAVQGSLDQGQTAETLRGNLGRVLDLVYRMEADYAGKFERTYNESIFDYMEPSGSPLAPSQVPMIPQSGNIMAPPTTDAGNDYGMTPEELEELERLRGGQQ